MQDKATEKFSIKAHSKIYQCSLHCLSQCRLAVHKTPRACRHCSPDCRHQIKATSMATGYRTAFCLRSCDFQFNLICRSRCWRLLFCLEQTLGMIDKEMLEWIIRVTRKKVWGRSYNKQGKHSWWKNVTRRYLVGKIRDSLMAHINHLCKEQTSLKSRSKLTN
jgi:hypothetical protein